MCHGDMIGKYGRMDGRMDGWMDENVVWDDDSWIQIACNVSRM